MSNMPQLPARFSSKEVNRLYKIENDIGALFELLKEINDKTSEQLKSDKTDHESIRTEIRKRNFAEKVELEGSLEKAAKKSKLYLSIVIMFVTLFCGFLGWYANKSIDEYKMEQKSVQVDRSIQDNTKKISNLETMTIDLIFMTERGFDRIDQVMIKATGINESDLPPAPPEMESAVEKAKTLKVKKHIEDQPAHKSDAVENIGDNL